MRKILHYIILFAIICNIISCKPQKDESCAGILCKNGSSCNNGDCICINGYTGRLCEIPVDSCTLINCGPHGTCVSGHCNCDPNWTGPNCDQQIVPIDSFPGSYILSGYKQQVDTSGTTHQTPFSDTVEITGYNGVTLILNSSFLFNYQPSSGSPDNYNYIWYSQTSNNFAVLGFSKTMNDSVFYDAWNYTEHIVLSGQKQ
jgi:hypothetical protein